MQSFRTWTTDSIEEMHRSISLNLLTFLEDGRQSEAVEYCMTQVMAEESGENDDLSRLCHIIAVLNLISESQELRKVFASTVGQLEKLADALLHKNNVKPGKSKLSFLHGQVKQEIAAISKSDGDVWGALWESGVGLMLSRGSSDPVLPQQHIKFAIHCIDHGLPLRVIPVLDEMLGHLKEGDKGHSNLAILKARAFRLSGNLEIAEHVLDNMKSQDKLNERYQWEKYFLRALRFGEVKELHRLLYKRNKPLFIDYQEAYLKHAFWLMAQSSKNEAKLCPKISVLKKQLKKQASQPRIKKAMKVLSVIEECHDSGIPLNNRVKKVGAVMPTVMALEAEYRLLAFAALTRFFNQRQKQMASVFHSEYKGLALKMSESQCADTYDFFNNSLELEVIKPFYDSLRGEQNTDKEETPDNVLEIDWDAIKKASVDRVS